MTNEQGRIASRGVLRSGVIDRTRPGFSWPSCVQCKSRTHLHDRVGVGIDLVPCNHCVRNPHGALEPVRDCFVASRETSP